MSLVIIILLVAAAVVAAAVLGRGPKAPAARPTEPACDRCGRPVPADRPVCRFCPQQVDRGMLEVLAGPLAGKTVLLDESIVAIASDVSRKHAAIRKTSGGYEIADLGGEGGTYVNGQRIGRARLAPGDQIRAGTTEMIFRAASPEAGPGT